MAYSFQCEGTAGKVFEHAAVSTQLTDSEWTLSSLLCLSSSTVQGPASGCEKSRSAEVAKVSSLLCTRDLHWTFLTELLSFFWWWQHNFLLFCALPLFLLVPSICPCVSLHTLTSIGCLGSSASDGKCCMASRITVWCLQWKKQCQGEFWWGKQINIKRGRGCIIKMMLCF